MAIADPLARLPAADQAYLKAKQLTPAILVEGRHACLVFSDYRLPPGYSETEVELLVRLPAGWPDVKPDMFWVRPAITYANGASPRATKDDAKLGRTWQRFSRHLTGGWTAGDGLETWMAMIWNVLASEVPAS